MEPSVPFSFLEYLLKTYQTSFKEIIKIIVGIIPLVDGINKNQVDGYPEIDMVTMPCELCTSASVHFIQTIFFFVWLQ